MSRKGTAWRNKMFRWAWMLQRGRCANCGCGENFIWRKGGISGSYEDGDMQQFVWRTSNLELDHVTPLHLGGSNEGDNLQLLCVDCHKHKTASERRAA